MKKAWQRKVQEIRAQLSNDVPKNVEYGDEVVQSTTPPSPPHDPEYNLVSSECNHSTSSSSSSPIKAKKILNKPTMKYHPIAAMKKKLKKAWQRKVQEIRTQLSDNVLEKNFKYDDDDDENGDVNIHHETNRKRNVDIGPEDFGVSPTPKRRRKMFVPSAWIQRGDVKRRRTSSDVVVVSPDDFDDETGIYNGVSPPKRRKITVPPSQLKRAVVSRRRKRIGRVGSSLERTFIPYNPNIVYEYYDDPNELCDRLKLLYSSQNAGNSNHSQEINSIVEELHERGIIHS